MTTRSIAEARPEYATIAIKKYMGIAILLADDEELFRESMREVLASHGYEVLVAADSSEAITALVNREFDVVLAGEHLPGGSNFDVLRKSKQVTPETEVIILTAFSGLDSALKSMRNGAFDYLEKPLTSDALLAAISRALDHRGTRMATSLYEASRAILDARDPQRLPEIIVEVTRDVMRADNVSLMLPSSTGELYIAHSHAMPIAVLSETRIPIGDRIAGRVASLRDPVLLTRDLGDDPRFADIESHGNVQSSIVYPMSAGDRLVGVLSISRTRVDRPFHQHDLQTASIIASQVSLALENRRLIHESVQSDRLATVGQIAASVAHEINNPISYVLASQGYLDEQLTRLDELVGIGSTGSDQATSAAAFLDADGRTIVDEIRQAAAEIREGALRVADIVRDLSALARTEDGTPPIFDLNESIRSALRLTGLKLKRATVIEELDDDVLVRGNPARISQVFVNLLVNASQSFRSTTGNQLVVRSRRTGSSVAVRVSDNGCGIRREHLTRVFETFFTTKSSANGTGLGLSISRDTIRSCGGDIHVESIVGEGTAFTVVLPYAGKMPTRPVPEPPRLRTGETPRPMKMLFVDDEPTIRRGYDRVFGKTNVVFLAADGEEATKILREHNHFDVIVCDLMMPRVSGSEFYHRVKADHPALASAFIFVTGGAMDPVGQEFLATLDNVVLTKPFEMRELIEQVERRRPLPRS